MTTNTNRPETTTTPAPLRLNADAINQANSLSHFDAGDVLARDANAVYLDGMKLFTPRPEWTPEQAAYMARRAETWRELCEKSFNDVISRRGSWAPWSVTGRANYNSRKMNARADAEMNAARQWAEKRARFLHNTKKGLASLVPLDKQLEAYRRGWAGEIAGDDPHALEKLDARITFLKAEQERYKKINAHYRKHKTLVGYEGLSDEKARGLDDEIKSPNRMYNVPFPPYVLQNNNANIRRLEQRRAQLQKARDAAQAAPETNAPKTFDTFQVQEDAQTMRLKIIFDDKPDADTRALLKSHGFRWAPSVQAWQRQLTPNARYALRRLLDKMALGAQEEAPQEQPAPVAPAAPNAPETSPGDLETITLAQFAARVKNLQSAPLSQALERAIQAARLLTDAEDGGTCNFDAPVLHYRPAGLTKKQAMAALQAAGLTCFEWAPFQQPKNLVINGFLSGQGNRRTRMAEAFRDSMTADGYTVTMYQQMD